MHLKSFKFLLNLQHLCKYLFILKQRVFQKKKKSKEKNFRKFLVRIQLQRLAVKLSEILVNSSTGSELKPPRNSNQICQKHAAYSNLKKYSCRGAFFPYISRYFQSSCAFSFLSTPQLPGTD